MVFENDKRRLIMIDFTDLPHTKRAYNGANGKKLAVIYNENTYMLKFPNLSRLNDNMSYANDCFSEYIGCHIFKTLGFEVQETLLGVYRTNNKENIVVACKDFCVNGFNLQDFGSIKNTIIESHYNGYETDLENIISTINNQRLFDSTILTTKFWDMFIVDSLIGNSNRHNGNWGFLYNQDSDEIKLAPIYDCGSCLFPESDETIMKGVIDNQTERDLRIFDIPLSAIKINGNNIRYFDFISSLSNEDCNKALLRIVPKINLDAINTIIEETPFATSLQKEFYKTILSDRKTRILDFSYDKLTK